MTNSLQSVWHLAKEWLVPPVLIPIFLVLGLSAWATIQAYQNSPLLPSQQHSEP